MGKCEKDFSRQVFSFLSCLIDALPLSLISESFKQGWVKRVARINPSATK